MFGFFHADLLRKYTIAFGTLFNEIYVERRNNSGARVKTLKVPLAYGPKEKFIVREAQDPDLNRKISMSLPRLSFERTGMFYDGERKLSSTMRDVVVDVSNEDNLITQFTPVPYTLNYTLSAMTHYAEDGDQIAEQIIPYFTPEYTISMKLTETGISRDIPITLESVALDDAYEGNFEDRRLVIWTFNFLMKGWLFGPVSKRGVITESTVNSYIPEFINDYSNTPKISKLVVTPGQLANGAPTSNASLTIARDQIAANSTWNYIEVKTDYNDGVGG